MLKACIRTLFNAVTVGNYQSVDSLLKEGVDPDARDEKGNTPLIVASERAYNNIVRLLIASGADVNARSDSGWSPLMSAACYGRYDTVQVLLEKGADASAKTTGIYPATATFAASANGHDDIVKLLEELN